MSDVKAAGAVCYLQDKKKFLFLLLRSAKTGEWGPPKGHMDPGETELETASREIFEEAGVRRASFIPGFREALHYTVEKKGKQLSKETVLFLCRMDSDKVQISNEHTEAHFATLDEIEVLVPHEDLRETFRKAYAHIQNPQKKAKSGGKSQSPGS
jgi:bis(5'-nucleosidyl)-tetraphosphatase